MYNDYPYMQPYMNNDMYGTGNYDNMDDAENKDYMSNAEEYMPQYYMPSYYMPQKYMPQSYMPMGYMKTFPMETERYKKCVKVPEVIGKNSCQILLETEIPFPAGAPALEVKDIVKEVKELVLSVCKDKVLINGKLHKNINYKTLQSTGKIKCNCNDLDVAYGELKHVSIWIPFSGYMDVPGAMPGDTVEVEYAGAEDCCEIDILKDPCHIKGCEYPVYRKLKEKVIVKIEVKVLRPVQITVDPERPNICP
ncbi:MAG: DUF3794 domain-containing protein [Clostridiales bacterium]|jgi:hypothetical protein|nr:DUF3794 domain-containing protein [Eubacteriales bacterium]MDH7564872.1 DUF3794 domain-containing protein [Clostridiales bacterium]